MPGASKLWVTLLPVTASHMQHLHTVHFTQPVVSTSRLLGDTPKQRASNLFTGAGPKRAHRNHGNYTETVKLMACRINAASSDLHGPTN